MSKNGRVGAAGDDDESWFPGWGKALLGLGAAVVGAAAVGYAVSNSSSPPQPSPQRPPSPQPPPPQQPPTRTSNAEYTI